MRDTGISTRWYDVLVHLEDEPEGLRMSELAEQILYTKSSFTRVIDKMEEAGSSAAYVPKTIAARSSSSSPRGAARS